MIHLKFNPSEAELLHTLLVKGLAAAQYTIGSEPFDVAAGMNAIIDFDKQVAASALKPSDHTLTYTMDSTTIFATVCKNTIEVPIEALAYHLHVPKSNLQMFCEELLWDSAQYGPIIDSFIQHENWMADNFVSNSFPEE